MNPILTLCSRDHGHKEVYSRLESALDRFEQNADSWYQLIQQAENQGIVPLVHKHLRMVGISLPSGVRRQFQSLCLRAARSAEIRNNTIAEIIEEFKKHSIELILLKGIALCNTVYSSPSLRPMRDIDILIGRENTDLAVTLLEEMGFHQEIHPDIPDDYHHLQPMKKTIHGLPVTIEIHRELLPKHYNMAPIFHEEAATNAESFTVSGTTTAADTLSLENALYYKYLHGFRAPLTFEPYRLIHVADLINFVEHYLKEIDWNKTQSLFPSVFNVLSRLHFLTPWHPNVTEYLPLDIKRIPSGVGASFCGWPQRNLDSIQTNELLGFIRNTICPPQWWTQIYYGHLGGKNYFRARLIEHPRTLWRWAKAFRHHHLVAHQKNH